MAEMNADERMNNAIPARFGRWINATMLVYTNRCITHGVKLGGFNMSISSSTLLVLSTLLLASCATTPSGLTYDSPVGVWNEKYKTMGGTTGSTEVTIIDETKGTYITPGSGQEHQLEFYSTEDPHTWKGHWIRKTIGSNPCSTEKSGSMFWGELIYHFNETYNQYRGTFDFCGKGDKNWVRGVR